MNPESFGDPTGPASQRGEVHSVELGERYVEMACCGFRFSADHEDADKPGHYSCPICAPASKSWWFLEWPQGTRGDMETGWWYGREGGNDRFSWDAQLAIRFHTKADAEAVRAAAAISSYVMATEHMCVGAGSAPALMRAAWRVLATWDGLDATEAPQTGDAEADVGPYRDSMDRALNELRAAMEPLAYLLDEEAQGATPDRDRRCLDNIVAVMREKGLALDVLASEIQDHLTIAGYDVPLRSYADPEPKGTTE